MKTGAESCIVAGSGPKQIDKWMSNRKSHSTPIVASLSLASCWPLNRVERESEREEEKK